MRPPSSGGSGNKLKTAGTTLRIRAFLRLSAKPSCNGDRQIANKVERQRRKHRKDDIIAGPAAATNTMSRRGDRSF
jgi:hypothetical protein